MQVKKQFICCINGYDKDSYCLKYISELPILWDYITVEWTDSS